MRNGAVLAGTIHSLEDDEQRRCLRGIDQMLLATQAFDALAQKVTIVFVRSVKRRGDRLPIAEVDLLTRFHQVVVKVGRHDSPPFRSRISGPPG